MKKSWIAVLLLAAGLVTKGVHAAAMLAVDVNAVDAVATPTVSYTYGYKFTVDTGYQYRVTSLGVFDYASGGTADGLTYAHDVGLWSGDGSSLLASATVPARLTGTVVDSNATLSGSGVGDWRFVDLGTPVVLGPGSYLIGAFFAANASNDEVLDVLLPTTLTTLSGITVNEWRSRSSSALTAPTGAPDTGSSIGPSFRVESVPEPATLALFGLGLAGIGAVRRRKLAA